MTRLSRLVGNVLIGVGVLLLLGVSLAWIYGEYLGWQAEQERRAFIRTFPTPVAPATLPITATATPAAVEDATPRTAPLAEPTRESSPTATAPGWQTAPPPLRITVPAIDLDTKVVPAIVKDGTWEVPKFVAGYLEGTGRPSGDGGNVVLSGHLQSLTSGNVFARLGELEAGDVIVLYTDDGVFEYAVASARLVTPRTVEVTYPTDDPRVTLITCAGDWDPIAQDYTQRLVVAGELATVNGAAVD